MAQSTFSHHISELVGCGLLTARKDGKFMRLAVDEGVARAYIEELHRKLLMKES